MTVSAEEFIRRFLLHVLPRGFVRIRNFGFLANARRAALLPVCGQLLGMAPPDDSDSAHTHEPATWVCPVCRGIMITVQRLTPVELSWAAPLCSPFDTS